MRPLTRAFCTVGLDGHSVQITITEAVTSEGFGGQIIPRFRLGILKARRWSLVDTRVPVQGVSAETSGAGGDAIGCRRNVTTGN